MNFIKKTAAVFLAFSMLSLSACHSQKRDLTGVDDNSSQAAKFQNAEKLSFTTTDIDGNEVSLDSYGSAKVIMFNMWEPGCGPCRGELPDLQKLYEKYKSKGLMIVGVFSDEDGLRDVVEDDGIEYPMIRSCAAFDSFQTGYVPTTFFTDGSGNVLSEEPYVGSKSYDEWESVILSYLK